MARDWDSLYLGWCAEIAEASKDPRRQVGSIIVRPDKTVASLGWNGFPRGVRDDNRLDDRTTTNAIVIHAEMNAILHAREPLHGYTLYTSICPCIRCAAHIIQTGITTVVFADPHQDIDESFALLTEADIAIRC